MSKEENGGDPYGKIVILVVLLMSVMSIGIFVISDGVQTNGVRVSETLEDLDLTYNFLESDIQSVLEDDAAKYETGYAYLQDLYILNHIYQTMVIYNISHPGNYTPQDFNDVLMEFDATLRQLILVIQNTWVWQYSTAELGATVENNYTYRGQEYFLIQNHWNSTSEPIHPDIRDYVHASFAASVIPVELPEVKMPKWTINLYDNLSILQFTSYQTGIEYFTDPKIPFQTAVNTSLADLGRVISKYAFMNEKIGVIKDYFNNTLITLATSAVVLGFTVSFNNKKYRMITLIIGLIVLFLSIVYLGSTMSQYSAILNYEATQILIYG